MINDINVKFREAIVTDNNDPDKKGAVQARVFPELMNVPADLLPWVYPFQEIGITANSGKHSVPEVGANIRVMIEDDYWQRIYYTSGDFIPSKYIYNKITTAITAMSPDISAQTYPQPAFTRYEDGTITFHNSSTGETGVYHKSGTYQVITSSGDIIMNTKLNKLKFGNTAGSLKDILKDLVDVLTDVVTPMTLLGGDGLPVVYLNATANLPKLTLTLTKLNNILKD